MTAKNIDRRIIFEGDVILNKGEFQLKADRLEVTLAPTDRGTNGPDASSGLLAQMTTNKDTVERIEAFGQVEVTQGDRHGKAQRAIYDQKEEKVILTGDPEVWEKDYRVSGKRMIFFLREDKNIVEDSKAVVYPK